MEKKVIYNEPLSSLACDMNLGSARSTLVSRHFGKRRYRKRKTRFALYVAHGRIKLIFSGSSCLAAYFY